MSDTQHEAELVPVSELVPHPRNYREHPEEQLEHIAASIREHGFYRNVVIANDGTILAGHGATEAAKRVGLEAVPCVRVEYGPDDPRALKLLASDNTLGMVAEDDPEALAAILSEVEDSLGLMGTGVDEVEIEIEAMTPPESFAAVDVDEMETDYRCPSCEYEWKGSPR